MYTLWADRSEGNRRNPCPDEVYMIVGETDNKQVEQ